MRPRRLALVLIVAIVLVAPTPADATPGTAWVRPVGGRVVRPFDPPKTRFGAGHLGVDLAAARRTPVHAAGPGIVTFAGSVAHTLHVVIAHAGGLRTSYSFLATIAVRRGQAVARNEVVGTSGGIGEGHDGSVLHFGLRAGDDYVDPALLFPIDLTTVVHLDPTTDPRYPASNSTERRGLLAGFALGLGRAAHGAGTALTAAADGVVAAEAVAERSLAAAFPLPAAPARGLAEWLSQYGHCDSHAPPADGEGGSDHRAMVVAGIDSHLAAGDSSLRLPAPALGYEPDEISYFSYARGADYGPADTEGPLLGAARRLGAQLRALQRRNPGREVDLLAHSQGGVVVEAFLTLVYDPGDPAYPPLGTVVTLSSPLAGDPLATAAADIARTDSGRALLRRADAAASRLHVPVPRSQSAAVRDLAEDSALMRRLDASRLPDQVQLTAIGAATDAVVPAGVATRPGARATVVVPRALNAHDAIVTDPAALRVVRAALENRPLPCQSLATLLAGHILPPIITTLEHDAGTVGELAGHLADLRP